MEYRWVDSEQMAEYDPYEASGVGQETPAMVQVQLCDWLKSLLKVGYRWLAQML